MTLTRRGSRLIVVDGISYRWLIRQKPTWNDIHFEIQNMPNGVPLRVAIEQENAKGALLLITSSQPWLTKYQMVAKTGIVQPSDVERWIKKALAAGWTPEKPGPIFQSNGSDFPSHA
jgi:acylphosphatase